MYKCKVCGEQIKNEKIQGGFSKKSGNLFVSFDQMAKAEGLKRISDIPDQEFLKYFSEHWTPICKNCFIMKTIKAETQVDDEYILSKRLLGKTEQGATNFVVFSVIFVFGVFLCLTGIGAFFGIPLIIVGFFMMLGKTTKKAFEYSLKCPNCKATNSIFADNIQNDVVQKCSSCKKEIIIRNDKVIITHDTLPTSGASNKIQNQQNADLKKCIFCAELIKEEAVVCRYCGRDLERKSINRSNIQKKGKNFIVPASSRPIKDKRQYPIRSNPREE